ncbi:L-arabinose transport system permease protein AraQ [Clavibacter michiganensis]|nr:L-arabinose transport system permease protein AraQ [Clavibacter michiganensis]
MTATLARPESAGAPSAPGRPRRRLGRPSASGSARPPLAGTYLALALAVLVMLMPLVWMVLTSFKDFGEIYSVPLKLLPSSFAPTNYATASDTVSFQTLASNSVIKTIAGSGLKVLLGLMTAYALVFIRVPFRNVWFGVVILALLVPQQIVMIPNYQVVAGLGWINTYPGLILPGVASAYGTFLFRQHFLTLPGSVLEAAAMDGAGHLRRLWSFVIPMSGPTIAAVALVSVVGEWNDYLWPLLVTTDPRMMTLPVGLTLLQDTTGITNWGVLMAGTVIVTLPVLAVFLVFQRRIVGGLTAGAVTG